MPVSRRGGARAALFTSDLQMLLLVLFSVGCSQLPERRNVVLIVVDTLRFDHVGSYGAERDTTPFLDRLSSESLHFDRAYSTAPWTKPSVASILSGLYPKEHGAERLFQVLPKKTETLAEILSTEGFATAGFVSHLFLAKRFGFEQGFDQLDQSQARGHSHISTEGLTHRALKALERMASKNRPFFLFVHYFDPHYTYRDHPEIDFAPRATGRLEGSPTIQELRAMDPPPTSEELAYLKALYDEEIRHTDTGIGQLLGRITKLGLDRNTVVVFTADHGEEFQERGWIGHAVTLHEELIHVPLLMRVPGIQARSIPEPVSLTAIVPTLLELLGIESANERVTRRSIAGFLSGESSTADLRVFSEVNYADRKVEKASAHASAVIEGHLKLIRNDRSGSVELFDLLEDPGETQDRSSLDPATTRRLLEVLEGHIERDRANVVDRGGKEISPSPEEIKHLEELGYIVPRDSGDVEERP